MCAERCDIGATLTCEDISAILVSVNAFGGDKLDRKAAEHLMRFLGLQPDFPSIREVNHLDNLIDTVACQLNTQKNDDQAYLSGVCNMISSNNILEKDELHQAVRLMGIDMTTEKIESLMYYLARDEWDAANMSNVPMIDENSVKRFIQRYRKLDNHNS